METHHHARDPRHWLKHRLARMPHADLLELMLTACSRHGQVVTLAAQAVAASGSPAAAPGWALELASDVCSRHLRIPHPAGGAAVAAAAYSLAVPAVKY